MTGHTMRAVWSLGWGISGVPLSWLPSHPLWARSSSFARSGRSHHPPRSFLNAFHPLMSSLSSMADHPDESLTADPAKMVVVDPFCFRQFAEHGSQSQGYGGLVFDATITVASFEAIVQERYHPSKLRDGYAPFCKHLFVVNDFTNATSNTLRITPDNQALLRTKYEARNDRELPVLVRYFPQELLLAAPATTSSDTTTSSSSSTITTSTSILPKAKYLDLILYSREQINAENAAQNPSGSAQDSSSATAPWGIVSIKAQDVDYELPMSPITVMRNALGKEEGGSGVPLDRESYLKSVEYWSQHAIMSYSE